MFWGRWLVRFPSMAQMDEKAHGLNTMPLVECLPLVDIGTGCNWFWQT